MSEINYGDLITIARFSTEITAIVSRVDEYHDGKTVFVRLANIDGSFQISDDKDTWGLVTNHGNKLPDASTGVLVMNRPGEGSVDYVQVDGRWYIANNQNYHVDGIALHNLVEQNPYAEFLPGKVSVS